MSLVHTITRRLAAPALALAATLSLVGCGGGGGYYDVYAGTLRVENNFGSFETIETIEISQPFGPVDAYDVFLAPGDAFEVDLRPDFYDLRAFWSDGSVDSLVVDINDGQVTTVVLTN